MDLSLQLILIQQAFVLGLFRQVQLIFLWKHGVQVAQEEVHREEQLLALRNPAEAVVAHMQEVHLILLLAQF
jgi:hypothetical protein